MQYSNEKPRTVLLLLVLAGLGLVQPAAAQSQSAPQNFATPEEAAAALASATRSHDSAALHAIFGPDSDRLLASGDRVSDKQSEQRFTEAYDQKHALVPQSADHVVLQVGADDWPLPIPLVQQDGRWHFDTAAGAQEIVDRRIGRNELETIRTMRAFVDAQRDYYERARQQTGTGFFAQRLASTPGRKDGLYWPAENNAPESPLGPLVTAAQEEGYPGELVGGRPIPYRGYLYRILREQGEHGPEGAKSYVRNGRMTDGFALIAWPAQYGVSGIMTFIVNHDDVVFQKDLGEMTAKISAHVTRFDPDLSWARIDVAEQ
jgi:hypothetical protein